MGEKKLIDSAAEVKIALVRAGLSSSPHVKSNGGRKRSITLTPLLYMTLLGVTAWREMAQLRRWRTAGCWDEEEQSSVSSYQTRSREYVDHWTGPRETNTGGSSRYC